jgi:hypothetical protein
LIELLEGRLLLAFDTPRYSDPGPSIDPTARQGEYIDVGFTPASLPELGMGLGGLSYYMQALPFSNALLIEDRGWRYLSDSTTVPVGQLDVNGYPTALNGATVFAQPFQNNGLSPTYPLGRYVVTWEGNGDVTLNTSGATLVSGSAAERRRVYNVTSANGVGLQIRLSGQNAPNHVRNVKVWLPDPSSPTTKSLEPPAGQRGSIIHPSYLSHLAADPDLFGVVRFMDWTDTNNNPQVHWSDRRPPGHAFAGGASNWKRLIIPGTSSEYGSIGVPWEHVIELANALGKDAWINVPHAATDDYVRNLARLVRFGSDANGNPYTSPQSNPYYAPLRSDLRVWVEHSNEIWSGGGSFRQGDWAQQQATALGVTKGAFNGRRAGEIWQIFNEVFDGQTHRVVKPAGAWTANTSYTRQYLEANVAFDSQTVTDTRPDVLAVTTYFGQPLVNWAFDNRVFMQTTAFNDPNDATVHAALDYLLNELVLAGTATGGERDAATGGFGSGNQQLAQEFGLPLVSYEGNSSMYTETAGWYLLNADNPSLAKIVQSGTPGATYTFSLANYVNANYPDDDTNPGNTDRLTKLILAVNRNPRFADIYKAHLANAKSLGLYMHGAFVDNGGWGKYGQWGHKEYQSQPVGPNFGQAVKWQALLDWVAEQRTIRELGIGSWPRGTRPDLPEAGRLDAVFAGQTYDRLISGTPGDGNTTWTLLAGQLPVGLTFQQLSNGSARISGSVAPGNPSGEYRILVRALDSDGDVDYGIYSLRVLQQGETTTLARLEVGGAVQSQTSFLDANLDVPGLTRVRFDNGPGLSNVVGVPGTLSFSGATSTSLSAAISNNDYLSIEALIESGKLVSFGGLDLRLYAQNGRTATFTLRSDQTGSTNLGQWTITGGSTVNVNLDSFASLRDRSGRVEFRLYVHGTNGNQYENFGIGNVSGNDAVMYGSVRLAPTKPPIAPGLDTRRPVRPSPTFRPAVVEWSQLPLTLSDDDLRPVRLLID